MRMLPLSPAATALSAAPPPVFPAARSRGSRRTGRGKRRTSGPRLHRAALSFVRRLFPPPEPLGLLLLGGGGGGLVGTPGGGIGGGWFEPGRRRKGLGLLGLLISVAFAAGNEKRHQLFELRIGLLVPALLGFKMRAWRTWVLALVLGLTFYALISRKESGKKF